MNLNSYRLHFYNKTHGTLQPHIWDELKNGMWRNMNTENYLMNSKIPANQPHKILDIFNEVMVIPEGSTYDHEKKQLKEELYYPDFIETDKNRLYNLFESYFSQFKDKRIAVHLSGGLDSSIIIGLLHHFKIPFHLVGLVSNRFEFRTEKIVQELLAPLGLNTVLIDMDEYPSFSNLSQKPLSQLPDDNIKLVEAGYAIAKTCKELGADVVFTGQGGDTIFVDAIPSPPESWGCNIGSEFMLTYEADVLYPEYGLEVVSPFADKQIIQAIYSIRRGQKNDHLKKWARQFFIDVLPRELVEYTYCADFFGTSMSGLEMAKTEIQQLFKTAYEITENNIFSAPEMNKFLKIDVFNFEYQDYIDYCNKISLATWYNGLLREGYVE